MKKAKNSKMPGFLRRLLVKVLAAAAAAVLLFCFVLEVRIFRGNDMYPSVRDGDLIICSRLFTPRAGDIVSYRDPSGRARLSRVIGLSGCEINITEIGELMTNGYIPSEEVFYRTERAEGSKVEYPLTVEDGRCFLLDDMRTIGTDSRSFGTVPLDDITGKVIYIVRRRGF